MVIVATYINGINNVKLVDIIEKLKLKDIKLTKAELCTNLLNIQLKEDVFNIVDELDKLNKINEKEEEEKIYTKEKQNENCV